MIEFWLVRHGETDVSHFNYPKGTKVIYGGYDIPLSKNGEFELDQVAKRLRLEHFHAIYSSPLSRCRYGAEKIQKGIENIFLGWRQIFEFPSIEIGSWKYNLWTI